MRLLSRFLTPILLLGAAAFVYSHNSSGQDIIALMFLENFFPSLQGDPEKLGQVTVGILAGVGALTLITSAIREKNYQAWKRGLGSSQRE